MIFLTGCSGSQVFLVLLLLLFAGFWVVVRLRKGQVERDEETSSITIPEPKAEGTVSHAPSESRPLTPIDAPMIQARLETLGLWEALGTNHKERLKRDILETCREGEADFWWAPLLRFAETVRFQKGAAPCAVVRVRCTLVKRVYDRVTTIAFLMRQSGIQITEIRDENGKPVPESRTVESARFQVLYKLGGTSGRLPVQVEDEELDIPDLVGRLNRLFIRYHIGYRLLLMGPAQERYCVLFTPSVDADRAAKSGWGQLCVYREGGGEASSS